MESVYRKQRFFSSWVFIWLLLEFPPSIKGGFMRLQIETFSFFQNRIDPLKDWVQHHPTAAKIARFAAGAFGTGLLLSLPFTSYYWAGKIATAAVAGVSLAVSLFVSAVLQKTPSVAQEVRPPAAASPAHPRRAPSELWSALQAKTERPPNGRTIATCRHPEIPVFTQEGAYHNLHARDVGKTSSSTFIASQTPMPDEIPRFWETICDQRVHLIVDLNLGREEEIMYYPNDDQVSQFGPFSLWKREGQSMTFPGYSVFNIRDFQRESFHGEVNHIRFPHKNLLS